ncbi:MAG: antibiotic biosynthesis monooxygenase [Immundisolibacteraceae bacterium]|nr:antibiotic biosynthesis monooxygenase [Immundisolibacteraceae bacterium]
MAGIRVMVTLSFPTKEIADQALEGMVPEYLEKAKEEGALQYELFRSVTAPEKVVLLEHWANRELYDQHWITQSEREGAPDPDEAAMLNPQFEFYRHENYDVVDGIWQPLDPAQRLSTIRWV